MRKVKAPDRFDASISSAEYHAMARAAERRGASVSHYCKAMLEEWYRFGLCPDHLADLLDPTNWRCERPRVFISSFVNQRHNVEIRFAGGGPGIYFEKDFQPQFMDRALSGSVGGRRSSGELFWMTGLFDFRDTEVERLLLYGHKARLDEVIVQIREKLTVVGAMPMSIIEQHRSVWPEFVPDISDVELWANRKLSETARWDAHGGYE